MLARDKRSGVGRSTGALLEGQALKRARAALQRSLWRPTVSYELPGVNCELSTVNS